MGVTVKEKRKALQRHCDRVNDCKMCPLEKRAPVFHGCYNDSLTDTVIEENYEIVFGPDTTPVNMQVMSREEHKENTLGNIRESVGLDPIKPEYYNDTKITPFDVIDDWSLNFYLGNAIKYIKRAGKKAGNSRLQDLKKVREYIDHEIKEEERKNG